MKDIVKRLRDPSPWEAYALLGAAASEIERLQAALKHADEQSAKLEAAIWPTAELNAQLDAENERLRAELQTWKDLYRNLSGGQPMYRSLKRLEPWKRWWRDRHGGQWYMGPPVYAKPPAAKEA